jgi:transcriptional regulator with XRE-family HTH domain
MAKPKRRVRPAAIVELFADRLRAARTAAGLTQAELAERAQVTASYIWRLETGGAAPGIDLVDRLALALGTTPASLLARQPDDVGELREQTRRMFESVLASAGRDDLVALTQILARFDRPR